jgi:hypothetical protein
MTIEDIVVIILRQPSKIAGVCVLAASLVSACVNPNEHAMKIGAPPIEDSKTITSLRAMQSRNFKTLKTENLIQASAATLQDLGFTVEEVSKEYGVLVGSKERDAVEAGQVTVQVILVLIAAIGGNTHNAMYDESQKINVTVVVNKIDEKSSQVRAFFDRHITNNQGLLWKADLITDAEIYQQFFEKLSASIFLEANKI